MQLIQETGGTRAHESFDQACSEKVEQARSEPVELLRKGPDAMYSILQIRRLQRFRQGFRSIGRTRSRLAATRPSNLAYALTPSPILGVNQLLGIQLIPPFGKFLEEPPVPPQLLTSRPLVRLRPRIYLFR